MGLFDINKEKRDMHLGIRGNFNDVVRYEEMQRRRRIGTFFWAVATISGLIGIYFLNTKDFIKMSIAFLITALIVVCLVFGRRHSHSSRHDHHRPRSRHRRHHGRRHRRH